VSLISLLAGVCSSMRMHFLAEAESVRPTDDDDAAARATDGSTKPTSCIRGCFHLRPVHVSVLHELQLLHFSAVICH